MKIYYDADCGICNQIRRCCEFLQSKNSQLTWHNQNISNYKDIIQESVVFETSDKKIYKYGGAVKKVFTEFIFPFNLLKYLPEFFLNFLYVRLRNLRNKYSKNICKIQ